MLKAPFTVCNNPLPLAFECSLEDSRNESLGNGTSFMTNASCILEFSLVAFQLFCLLFNAGSAE